MKEQVLLDYFKNKVSVEDLVNDLKGSRQSKGYTFGLDVEPLGMRFLLLLQGRI